MARTIDIPLDETMEFYINDVEQNIVNLNGVCTWAKPFVLRIADYPAGVRTVVVNRTSSKSSVGNIGEIYNGTKLNGVYTTAQVYYGDTLTAYGTPEPKYTAPTVTLSQSTVTGNVEMEIIAGTYAAAWNSVIPYAVTAKPNPYYSYGYTPAIHTETQTRFTITSAQVTYKYEVWDWDGGSGFGYGTINFNTGTFTTDANGNLVLTKSDEYVTAKLTFSLDWEYDDMDEEQVNGIIRITASVTGSVPCYDDCNGEYDAVASLADSSITITKTEQYY